jgi:hypothetical protein
MTLSRLRLYQSRRDTGWVAITPESGKQNRAVISTFKVAENIGFKGALPMAGTLRSAIEDPYGRSGRSLLWRSGKPVRQIHQADRATSPASLRRPSPCLRSS